MEWVDLRGLDESQRAIYIAFPWETSPWLERSLQKNYGKSLWRRGEKKHCLLYAQYCRSLPKATYHIWTVYGLFSTWQRDERQKDCIHTRRRQTLPSNDRGDDGVVNPLHRSGQNFLFKSDLTQFPTMEESHAQLAHSCINYTAKHFRKPLIWLERMLSDLDMNMADEKDCDEPFDQIKQEKSRWDEFIPYCSSCKSQKRS